MVNKKLLTSVFDIDFTYENSAHPGWVYYQDNGITPATPPTSQHKYLNDKVNKPVGFDTIYAGPNPSNLGLYEITWSYDQENEWDWNNAIVEKDLVLHAKIGNERTFQISFEVPNTIPIPSTGGNLNKLSFSYETLPSTITGIKNNATCPGNTQTNNYGTNYTLNKFGYNNDNVQHAVLRNASGNSCKWVDQYGNDFYFGTTKVVRDLVLHMIWIFHKWNFTVDYNTGSGRYYNDFSSSYNYTISGIGTKSYSANATWTGQIEDNFSLNNAPSRATITPWLSKTSTFYHWSLSADVKITGWYNDVNRTSGFSYDTRITAAKTIYARWVNSSVCRYYVYTSNSYQDYTRLSDWWNTVSSTYTIPSFCPTLTAVAMGPGGNSNRFTGNRATSGEYFEITICNPGGSASQSSATWSGDASKLSFEWLALGSSGSYTKSYIKRGSWEVASNRGNTGGSREKERYNLGDSGSPEEDITDGSRSVLGYFTLNGSKGKTMYTKIKDGYSSRSNTGITTQFRFRGTCSSSDWSYNSKRIDVYLEAWFYYNGTYYYPGLLHLGYIHYEVVGSNNSNEDQYGWRWKGGGWTGYAWWWTCGTWGNGGQCLFFSTQNDTQNLPNQCYGHGGYIGFYFPAN